MIFKIFSLWFSTGQAEFSNLSISKSPRSLSVLLGIMLLTISACSADVAGQNQEISREAAQLNSVAGSLQNGGEFKLAATKWNELLTKFPNTALTNKARYYLGVCYFQLQDWENALDAFEKTVKNAADDKDFSFMADANLFYGFSQYSLGKSETDEDAKGQLLAGAIKSYKTLLDEFPESSLRDQAKYFKAEAEYYSGNLEQSVETYKDLIANSSDSKFRPKAIFHLSETYFEMGDYENAYKSSVTYQDDYPNGDVLDQIRINIPSAEIQLAMGAANSGELEQADLLFKSAETKLAALSSDEQYAARDEALFKQAFCVLRQQRIKEAAALYGQTAEQFPESARAEEAAISAGRFFFKSNENEQATKWLEKVADADNQYSLEAIHWLCRIGLAKEEFAATFDRASAALEKAVDSPVEINLMLDAGDALYEIPDRRKEAAGYFKTAADKFPNHELAPQALYNAAFILLKVEENAEAIELCQSFELKYQDSEFFPDVREIIGEAQIKSGELAEAQKTFENNVAKFSEHPNVDDWNNRVGHIRYSQKDYDGVIAWLSTLIGDFKTNEGKAQALFRIGASQFQLENYEKAKQALNDSIAADSAWEQADEANLLLGRTQHELGDEDSALKTLEALKVNFPKTNLVSETDFRIAEVYYDQQNFDLASTQYQKVIAAETSAFQANAMYGLAWIDMKQERFDSAIQLFDKLMTQFPKHALFNDAMFGRGMSNRLAGNHAKAIDDFEEFLKKDLSEEQKVSTLYERGLAEVGLKRWNDAVDTFSTLVEISPDSAMSDKYYYELAWAQKDKGDEDKAIISFRKIVTNFSKSSLAAESSFHAAQADYKNKKYDAAIEGFKFCNDNTQSKSLKEKAIYKLARSHFNLGQFDQAHDLFKIQVDEFPDGELAADAYSMIGESLFKSEKHALAVSAYRLAIPEISRSATATPGIEVLSRLHGAQAANLAEDYKSAIEFAEPIIEKNAEWEFAPEAWYEIGAAYHGLGENEKAIAAWQNAVGSFNQTGARACFMIGETLFGQKEFEKAIQQFKLVIYGFGGDDANDQVKQWQANSAYEAARCSFVRISSTEDPNLKSNLIADAKKMYELVVIEYPNSSFVAEAKKNLKTLESLD